MNLIPLVALGAGVYLAVSSERARAVEQATGDHGGVPLDFSYLLGEGASVALGWQPPATAAPYLGRIRAAEQKHGIPHNLLARLIYQESRYRADIIRGETVSSAGAVGIAQIVPRWHPNVDPLDVSAAIDYAGGYLAALYRQFGTWAKALAAYNWGPGNVGKVADRANWLASAPTETRNYVNEITGDVAV